MCTFNGSLCLLRRLILNSSIPYFFPFKIRFINFLIILYYIISQPQENETFADLIEWEEALILLLGCLEKLFLIDDLFSSNYTTLCQVRKLFWSKITICMALLFPLYQSLLHSLCLGLGKPAHDDLEMQLDILFDCFSSFTHNAASLRAVLALVHLLAALTRRASSVP